jgi:hypothetical protein
MNWYLSEHKNGIIGALYSSALIKTSEESNLNTLWYTFGYQIAVAVLREVGDHVTNERLQVEELLFKGCLIKRDVITEDQLNHLMDQKV